MRSPTVPAPASLWPFAALSASYFAHVGFFNPYLPLWLNHLGLGLLAIGVLTSLPSATRLFAPYLWAWLSDHTGHRVWLLRYCALLALLASLALWVEWSVVGLFAVLLLMFTHTSRDEKIGCDEVNETKRSREDAGRDGKFR